eukprot:TRINITY_DN2324_c0_g1_i3.p1 TRINITY_DN2324_c0_g1~~TRINITY_DN2324_c0_g1_i3.p1  ORF type:complete len:496 (+),score=126.78 TRINITY_DN2324_c0_g1_i3:21-1508(+)
MHLYLNVYDLIIDDVPMTKFNNVTMPLGFGAFHTAVQIDHLEFAFGILEGIHAIPAKTAEGVVFRRCIDMGASGLCKKDFARILDHLAMEKFQKSSYNIYDRNCNHFSQDLCMALVNKKIPHWINKLSKFTKYLSTVIPEMTPIVTRDDEFDTLEDQQLHLDFKKITSNETLGFVSGSSHEIKLQWITDELVIQFFNSSSTPEHSSFVNVPTSPRLGKPFLTPHRPLPPSMASSSSSPSLTPTSCSDAGNDDLVDFLDNPTFNSSILKLKDFNSRPQHVFSEPQIPRFRSFSQFRRQKAEYYLMTYGGTLKTLMNQQPNKIFLNCHRTRLNASHPFSSDSFGFMENESEIFNEEETQKSDIDSELEKSLNEVEKSSNEVEKNLNEVVNNLDEMDALGAKQSGGGEGEVPINNNPPHTILSNELCIMDQKQIPEQDNINNNTTENNLKTDGNQEEKTLEQNDDQSEEMKRLIELQNRKIQRRFQKPTHQDINQIIV